MEEFPSITRGLFSDLTRALSGTLIHLDDLLLRLNNDSDEYEDAFLANQQLGRAFEFFIQIRSLYMVGKSFLAQINNKNTSNFSIMDILMHKLNNTATVISIYCDILSFNGNKKSVIYRDFNNLFRILHNIQLSFSEILNKNTYIQPRPKIKASHIKAIKITKPLSETNNILLVEDDEEVRKLLSMGLEIFDYKVFDVASGGDAVRQFNQQDGNFILCIIDLELPDMHGPDIVKKLFLSKPIINTLYISGYNEYKIKEYFGLKDNDQTLMKPFRLPDFIEKVKSMITVNNFN